MTDLWRLDATEQARLIRTGAISSVELTKATLARVDKINPKINAIVDLMAQEALQAAAEADKTTKAGGRLGLLHGVPVTVKINVDFAGRANTNGVVAYKDNIGKEDNPVVSNIRKSGAVIIGRTNTPAFSMRWFTDNALHGRTLNPWNKDITPGGSSGGASARMAAASPGSMRSSSWAASAGWTRSSMRSSLARAVAGNQATQKLQPCRLSRSRSDP